MSKRWDLLMVGLICGVLGLLGGRAAFRGHGSSGPGAEPKGGEPEAHEDHASAGRIAPETLKNLKVEIGPIKVETFTQYRSIPALVANMPRTEQPVIAPIAGRIESIHVEPGMVIQHGTVLARLVRQPIPRPELHFTEEIIKPANEELHKSVLELRKAEEEVRIAKTELARIEEFMKPMKGGNLPVLPSKMATDMRYALSRATKTYELYFQEIAKHGLTKEQIEQVVAGQPIPALSQVSWKRALSLNGLWTKSCEALLQAVPVSQHNTPWTIATIGELGAAGLIHPELITWLQKEKDAGVYFMEIGALLQKGYTVADLQRLHTLGAFKPIVEIRAPAMDSVADWDVYEIRTKPGTLVEAGAELFRLLNPRELYLKSRPVGGEKADLLRALGQRAACRARPLVPGTGPELQDLTIAFISSETGREGSVAHVEVVNHPLPASLDKGGRTHRSWQLRAGQKYVLRIPTRTKEKVYILPSDAVTSDGPDKVVFVQDGDGFKSVPVEIYYQDHEVAVVPINKDTALFPGDPVVLRGAFALGLALKADTGAIDPHAGHSH